MFCDLHFEMNFDIPTWLVLQLAPQWAPYPVLKLSWLAQNALQAHRFHPGHGLHYVRPLKSQWKLIFPVLRCPNRMLLPIILQNNAAVSFFLFNLLLMCCKLALPAWFVRWGFFPWVVSRSSHGYLTVTLGLSLVRLGCSAVAHGYLTHISRWQISAGIRATVDASYRILWK